MAARAASLLRAAAVVGGSAHPASRVSGAVPSLEGSVLMAAVIGYLVIAILAVGAALLSVFGLA